MPTLAPTVPTVPTMPTGAVYGMHVPGETRAESLPAVDVENLVGALRHDLFGHTDVTPLHLGLVRAPSGWSPDVIAHMSGGIVFVVEVKIFESTPSTIERARAQVLAVTPEPTGDPPAYEGFKALGRWLNADDAGIADMVGVGRTTPYTWKRDGREPRAATAQRIYEYHSTLDALRRRLGIVGLRRWLHESIPTRREVLLAGDLEGLESDVHAVLFRRPATQRIDLAAAPEEDVPVEAASSGRPLRPSRRRPRRSSG